MATYPFNLSSPVPIKGYTIFDDFLRALPSPTDGPATTQAWLKNWYSVPRSGGTRIPYEVIEKFELNGAQLREYGQDMPRLVRYLRSAGFHPADRWRVAEAIGAALTREHITKDVDEWKVSFKHHNNFRGWMRDEINEIAREMLQLLVAPFRKSSEAPTGIDADDD
ncbi:hypothetical protein G7Y89_g1170 [Cudoniella acicularis]|uniref:Uncharacterized protein n=1 Tax=Cudoniella acicularis TaxID=354080 RepID=A0A8H4RWU7_9HELO|nr:hypothetical protein G7Y89_g1170 [Cudoniella acicularis]